jgi:phenylalanyl-tRNA synthetase beta chain
MRFSLLMLKQAIKFNKNYNIDEISNAITSLGLEVEEIENPAKKYDNFIIAEVLECEKHPESTKLNLCKVNTGKEILDVVCGASNVRKGLKVVFAKIGAIVPESGLEIKKTSIRGKESNGMICSASELGLEGESEGIIELPETATLGMNFAEFSKLNDEIFHISITPNRGDACSVFGIARDLSAKGLGITQNVLQKSNCTFSDFAIKISEDIKNIVQNVNFAKFGAFEIPEKATQELEIYSKVYGSSGIPIVDLGNYLMFLAGSPMHIYDASKIKGEITIRKTLEGENFIPIKGDETRLPAGLLVVADDEKILSLLGVMGDARSKCSPETKEFTLEVLHVSPEEVIKSSRAAKIKSDSSYRFERGVDFTIQNKVLETFLSKLSVKNASLFSFSGNLAKRKIDFEITDYKKRIGINLETARIKEILLSLGFEILSETPSKFSLSIPPFRSDISISEDICEEIARIEGYEKIEMQEIQNLKPVINFDLNFEIKKILSEEMQEIITYSFFKDSHFGLFSTTLENKSKLKVLNPITQELAVMRDSLIPNLLENISNSEKKSHHNSSVFEVGTVFFGTSEKEQKTNIVGLFSGNKNEKSFLKAEEKFTIWEAKNKMLEVLSRNFGISENSLKFSILENKNFHTHQSFNVFLGKNLIAILAAIPPLTLDAFQIKEKVFCFEIYMENLPAKKQKNRMYKEEILPSVIREIAVIIPLETKFKEISSAIKSLKLQNLKEVFVTDIFADEIRIGKNLKSISLQFIIKQEEKTLTKEQIDGEIIESIVQILAKKFDAKLRDGEIAK